MKQTTRASRWQERGSLVRSFRHAAAGVAYVIRGERNARIHLVIGALVILVSLGLGLSRFEWALILLTIGIVLAGEMLNTAIELVVDLVEPQSHPMAGHAKDVAAGATLVAAIAAAAVGVVILLPKIWDRLLN